MNNIYTILNIAERANEQSKHTTKAKTYAKMLDMATMKINDCLKRNDFDGVLALEEIFQKNDFEHVAMDKEKSYKMYQELKNIRDTFLSFKNPEHVRNTFSESIADLNIVGTRHRDATFERSIRAQTRYLGAFIGARATYAEKSFYETRQNALLAIGREHQKNIDRAMGYEPAKSREQVSDKGLSR